MKKVYMLAAACVLAASVFCGCGRKADDTGQLQSFVSEINSQPGKELANGTVLLKCEYQKGDSLFTYHIKVDDKRFDEVSADSLKAKLSGDLASPDMEKLVRVLSRNGIGLCYKYELEDTVMTVVFTPEEIAPKN